MPPLPDAKDRHTMYSIANASLSVSILDPVADQQRFGTRYCTGGYIFQVDDSQHGALMSGPTYPDRYDPFNGQGIRNAVEIADLRGNRGDFACFEPGRIALFHKAPVARAGVMLLGFRAAQDADDSPDGMVMDGGFLAWPPDKTDHGKAFPRIRMK